MSCVASQTEQVFLNALARGIHQYPQDTNQSFHVCPSLTQTWLHVFPGPTLSETETARATPQFNFNYIAYMTQYTQTMASVCNQYEITNRACGTPVFLWSLKAGVHFLQHILIQSHFKCSVTLASGCHIAEHSSKRQKKISVCRYSSWQQTLKQRRPRARSCSLRAPPTTLWEPSGSPLDS